MNMSLYKVSKPLILSILGISLGSQLFINKCYAQSPAAKKAAPQQRITTLTVPDSLQLDLSQDVAAQLMSFEDIYELAISTSPLIKYQDQIATSQNAAYKLSKLEIFNQVTGFVNLSNGNQSIISSNLNNGDALGQISNGYRAGFNAQISIANLLGRSQLIRQARANFQAATVQKDIVKLQLKRELITAYQDLITSQQVLKVRIGDEQTAFAAYQVADLEARQGRKSPAEVAGSNSLYSQARTIAEESKGNFIKNAYYLEALVGVPIQQLKRK